MHRNLFRAFAVFVFALLIAAAGFADERRYVQRVTSTSTRVEQYSARDLKRMGVPDALIGQIEKQMPEKDIIGIPELPLDDYPSLSVYIEGTGDVRVNGTIPVTAPLIPIPVLVLARRADCAACDFRFMAPIWATSTETGFNPPRVDWYRVEETPDTLQWAYGGGFNDPGFYDIKLATLHPEFGLWMTQVFTVYEIEAVNFWAYGCAGATEALINFSVRSLQEITNGSTVTLDIPGVGVKTGHARVLRQSPRAAEVVIGVSFADYYHALAGLDVEITLTLPPATLGGAPRVEEEEIFFDEDELDPCNGKG